MTVERQGTPIPSFGDAIVLNDTLQIAVELLCPRRIHVVDDAVDLRALLKVVEASIRCWPVDHSSSDGTLSQCATQSITELAQIYTHLCQWLALGRETAHLTAKPLGEGCTQRLCDNLCECRNRTEAGYCRARRARLFSSYRTVDLATPGPSLGLTVAACSDPGLRHAVNKDTIDTLTIALADGATAQLCMVADGVGSTDTGAHASRTAVNVARTQIEHELQVQVPQDDSTWQALLHRAVLAANHHVYVEAGAATCQRGMATTLTIALIVGQSLHVASVGDSRAYLLNASGVTVEGASIAQLTPDQSLAAQLVAVSQCTLEEAEAHPLRHVLLQAIGSRSDVEVYTRTERLESGDVVLLCSDGLVHEMRDETIAHIALERDDPTRACGQLVALANARSGLDNVSVVLIRVTDEHVWHSNLATAVAK